VIPLIHKNKKISRPRKLTRQKSHSTPFGQSVGRADIGVSRAVLNTRGHGLIDVRQNGSRTVQQHGEVGHFPLQLLAMRLQDRGDVVVGPAVSPRMRLALVMAG